MLPASALEDGSVRLAGDPALLDRFVELFHIPSRCTGKPA
jgi:hypothetical protein